MTGEKRDPQVDAQPGEQENAEISKLQNLNGENILPENSAAVKDFFVQKEADPEKVERYLDQVNQRREYMDDWREADQKAKHKEPPRRSIYLKGGDLPRIVDQAEFALRESGAPIYQRSVHLVRPAVVQAGNYHGIERRGQTPIIQTLDANYLADKLTDIANFWKYDARRGDYNPVDCPKRVAETLLSRTGEWRVPHLQAIIEAPTLRPDGSLLDKPGYDSSSGLLLLPNDGFPKIPKWPTRKDLREAINALEDLVSTFPFVAAQDKSVALSAVLTALIRRSIPTAPLHGLSSPAPGTGKSLIVDVASMIATDKPAAVISQGESEEETEKRLHTALLQGDAVINIDNVERPLKGDTLCQMLTQTMVRVRVLGKSQTIDCPSNATIFATGNNMVLAGDITRRALVCRLDANCERPEERQFDRDIYQYTRDNRANLVKAGLVLLRSYILRHCPDMGLKPMGSYEQWSKWVRGALVWAGYADPYNTRSRILESDPVINNIRNLFHAWYEHFAYFEVSVHDLIEAAQNNDAMDEVLQSIASSKTGINTRTLGRWLVRHQDQIVDNLRLVKAETKRRITRWKIVKI